MSGWQTALTVLASTGVLAMLGALGREVWGWATGHNGRKMSEARTALSVMGVVGLWQDAYYRARQWCWTQHGYSRDYPQPPVELGRAADRDEATTDDD